MGGILFKNLLHGATNPHLRLADAEDVRQGGCYIELHHAVSDNRAALDAFTCDDERCFHLSHGFAAVALIDAAVVGSDDENGVFGHSGIVDSLDDFAYVTI